MTNIGMNLIMTYGHAARGGCAQATRPCSRCRQIVHQLRLAAPQKDAPPKGLRSGEFRRGTKTENEWSTLLVVTRGLPMTTLAV
jgi:hypothetical protein